MNVLVCDHFTQSSLSYLKAHISDINIVKTKNHRPSAEELTGCNAMLIRSRTHVDLNLLQQAPNLQFIITATSGFDHIDLKASKAANIRVAFTPEANAQSAAEHSLLLALSLLRKLNQCQQIMKLNQWREALDIGHEIYGKNWGILGLGRVGSRVARMARAFGGHIFAYDPYKSDEYFAQYSVERLGLSELLRNCDIVSIHLPLTPETHKILNQRNFKLMTTKSVLINTSRGPVIDENELCLALQQKIIAGAALDVFVKEPLPKEAPLRQLNNVILTPHIGAYTEEALNRASQYAVEKLISFIKNNELQDELSDENLTFQ